MGLTLAGTLGANVSGADPISQAARGHCRSHIAQYGRSAPNSGRFMAAVMHLSDTCGRLARREKGDAQAALSGPQLKRFIIRTASFADVRVCLRDERTKKGSAAINGGRPRNGFILRTSRDYQAAPLSIETIEPPSGAQSVHRAISVLRAIAASREAGVRLSDLVVTLHLNKATVRRLLLALIAEGLVTQEPQSRLYMLGFDLYALGLAAGRNFNMRSLCADSVRRVADESGDTVYLSVRTGDESVCVAHETGAFPIKIMNLSIGDRRPLGIGSGNVAMLAALTEPEIDTIVAGLSERLKQLVPSLGCAELLELVAQAKARGYHFHNGYYLPGVKSLAMAIRNPRGEPEAALTIAAVESRMGAERLPELVTLLQREVAVIENRLRSGS